MTIGDDRAGIRALTLVVCALAVTLAALACGSGDDAAPATSVPVATPVATPSPTPAPPVLPPPSRLAIPAIGVDAAVETLGLDADGVPLVPDNRQDAAWYDFSARPGEGSNVVMAGHLQLHQVRGIFWDLDQLQPGDEVQLTTPAKTFVYKVTHVGAVSSTDPDAVKVMHPTDTETLTLITCGGAWVPNPQATYGGDYATRTVVQAAPVGAG